MTDDHDRGATGGVELTIARLLLGGTLLGIALMAVGVGLMMANEISPDAPSFPVFDAGRLVSDLLALRPEGFLWAGIMVVVATPIARVAGELVAFARRRDLPLVGVALGILGIVALSVVAALLVEA